MTTRTVLALLLVIALAPPPKLEARESKIVRLRELLRHRPGSTPLMMKLAGHLIRQADETELTAGLADARHLLTQVLAVVPDEAEAWGWLGVARCVEAKYGEGASAKSLALAGLKDLDGAIARQPGNLAVRLMRAEVGLKVPREWGRLPQAREDLLSMEHAIGRRPELIATFGLDMSEVHLKLGEALCATGDVPGAMRAWRAASKIAPEGRFAREATRLVRKYQE